MSLVMVKPSKLPAFAFSFDIASGPDEIPADEVDAYSVQGHNSDYDFVLRVNWATRPLSRSKQKETLLKHFFAFAFLFATSVSYEDGEKRTTAKNKRPKVLS